MFKSITESTKLLFLVYVFESEYFINQSITYLFEVLSILRGLDQLVSEGHVFIGRGSVHSYVGVVSTRHLRYEYLDMFISPERVDLEKVSNHRLEIE